MDVRKAETKYLETIEKDLKNYPQTLQAKHIAKYLGVGVTTAYKLLKSGSMPVLSVPECKFIMVSKTLFIAWYAQRLLCQNVLDEKRGKDV